MKEKLKDVRGKKAVVYIVLKISSKLLKHIPESFYMDLTIDDVRDATPIKK